MRLFVLSLALLMAGCNLAPDLPGNHSDVPEAGSAANGAAPQESMAPTPATATPAPAATPSADASAMSPSDDAPAPAQTPAPATADTPSFACTGSLSRAETLVCNDRGLARLDRRLAGAYADALADADGNTRNALRESQRFFLAKRDACDTAGCVAQSYRNQLIDLPNTVATAPASCRGEIGEAAARRLVRQCFQVSGATHPPCNAANSCEMIRDEIDRSCAMFEPGDDIPGFCRR